MRLNIFPSDRCNLHCDYCQIDLNRGPATILAPADWEGAVGWLMDQGSADEMHCLSIFGGEPLIHFDLFRDVIPRTRTRHPARRLHLEITTNGLLLTPDKIRFFDEFEVQLNISIDGKKGPNDRHRKFLGKSQGSVHDMVAKNIGASPEKIWASTVVCPDTCADLAANLKEIRGLGLRTIGISANLFPEWTRKDQERLDASLQEVVRYLQSPEGKVLSVQWHGGPGGNRQFTRDCWSPTLGGDGYFYASVAALTMPYASNASLRVGDWHYGIDEDRLNRLLIEPINELRKSLGALKDDGLMPLHRLIEDFASVMRSVPCILDSTHWALLHDLPLTRIRKMLEVASVIDRQRAP